MAKTIKISCKCSDSLPIDQLKAFQGKLKTIDEESFNKLKASILKYGFSFPIFIWNKNILDGHQRFYAVQRLLDEGYELKDNALPVVWIEAKDAREAAEKLLLINSRYAKIDQQGFDIFIEDYDIKLEDIEIVLDIPEIDLGLGKTEDYEGLTDPDDIPEVEEEPVTKPGDIWLLGDHRLMCGDSTKIEDVERLMGGEKADMVFTDPPYGIDIVQNNQVGGAAPTKFNRGTISADNIVKASEYRKIINDNSTETAKRFYEMCIEFKFKNIILFGGNYFTDFLPISRCWVIWDKEMTGNFSEAEMAWTSFKKGGIKIFKHLWNGLSRKGNRKVELPKRVHPTQKPVGLFSEIFKKFDGFKTIFDGFSGSGTTIIAAQQTGRKCYAMEIDPHYVNVAVKRWEDFTGEKATLQT